MRKHWTVVVVDDDNVHLEVVRSWLEGEGFEVFTQDSPFGTGRLILQRQPDMVLLDVQMPGLEGDCLIDPIKKLARSNRLGIVFYSSKDPAELDALVRKHEVLGAIQKTSNGLAFLSQFRKLMKKLQCPPPVPT